MRKTITYFPVLLFIILIGCGPSKEVKQNKELEKLALEVMEVHDRSMPNHGKLFGLKKKLMAIHDFHFKMENMDTQEDSIIRSEVDEVLIDIEKADVGMMNWMHTYQAPEDYLPFEEKKAYYIDQKNKIEEVEILTNQTMTKAKELIAKYPVQ